MTCEAEKRGYKKVRVTNDINGWPVGSIVWLDEDSGEKDECWNDDCTESWFHAIGTSCKYVIEAEKSPIALLKQAAQEYMMTGDYHSAYEVLDLVIHLENK